jgi:hypothetical protein
VGPARRSPESALLHEKARSANIKPVVEEHTAVLEALRARDPAAARAAMRAHLPPSSTACSSPPRKRPSPKPAAHPGPWTMHEDYQLNFNGKNFMPRPLELHPDRLLPLSPARVLWRGSCIPM